VDGTWKLDEESGGEPVKANIAEMPIMDLVTDRGLARAVGWQGIELARATIGAVAVSKLVGAYTPFDRRHGFASPLTRTFFGSCSSAPSWPTAADPHAIDER
jgi:hypothetical protein